MIRFQSLQRILVVFIVIFLLIIVIGTSSLHNIAVSAQVAFSNTIDVSSLTELRDQSFTQHTRIHGNLPQNTEFAISNIQSQNGVQVLMELTFQNNSRVLIDGSNFRSGLKFVPTMLFYASENSNSLMTSGGEVIIPTVLTIRNSQFNCNSDSTCSGKSSDGLLFASLLFELAPIALPSGSSADATNVKITDLPTFSVEIRNSQVTLTDNSGFGASKQVQGLGGIIFSTTSAHNIDISKYQTTIFEQTKLGLDSASDVPVEEKILANDPSGTKDPAPHVSLSIKQNSKITCTGENAASTQYLPRALVGIGIAPSLSPSESPSFPGWTSFFNTSFLLTRKERRTWRRFDDNSDVRRIEQNGFKFNNIKFLLRKLEISVNTEITVNPLYNSRSYTFFSPADNYTLYSMGVFVSHVITDKVIVAQSKFVLQGPANIMGLMLGEVHGGCLPWLRDRFATTTTTTSITSIANNVSNSSSSSRSAVFVLPPIIKDLLPAVRIINTTTITSSKSATRGWLSHAQEISAFCFISIDINNLHFYNNDVRFDEPVSDSQAHAIHFQYTRQGDEVTCQHLKLSLRQEDSAPAAAGITLTHLHHYRDILFSDYHINATAEGEDLLCFAVFHLSDFWTFLLTNAKFETRTIGTNDDTTPIDVQRVQNGKYFNITHIQFHSVSSTHFQGVYFYDERVTNVETVIVEHMSGTVETGKAANLMTINVTSHNVTNWFFREVNIGMTGKVFGTSCFYGSLFPMGMTNLIVENMRGTTTANVAAGFTLMGLRDQDNVHNMVESETFILRNISGTATSNQAIGIGSFILLGAVVSLDPKHYGYFVPDYIVRPMVPVKAPMVVASTNFKATGFYSSVITSQSASIDELTVRDSDFDISSGKFFEPLQIPTVSIGELGTLNIEKSTPDGDGDSPQHSNNGCLTWGGKAVDSRDQMNAFIDRRYIKQVVAKHCGDTQTHNETPTETWYEIPITKSNSTSGTLELTRTRTKTLTATPPFEGYDLEVPEAAQALENLASISGIAGGSGATAAIEAARAVALLSLAQQCAQFKKGGDRGLSREERIQNFVDAYFDKPIKFPQSVMPFLCIPPERGNCVRGAIVADMLFLVFIFGLTMLYARTLRNQALSQMTPTQRMASSLFDFARIPFFLGMSFAWRVGSWTTRVSVLFSAPGLPSSDPIVISVLSVLLWTVLISGVAWLIWKHVNVNGEELTKKHRERLSQEEATNAKKVKQEKEHRKKMLLSMHRRRSATGDGDADDPYTLVEMEDRAKRSTSSSTNKRGGAGSKSNNNSSSHVKFDPFHNNNHRSKSSNNSHHHNRSSTSASKGGRSSSSRNNNNNKNRKDELEDPLLLFSRKSSNSSSSSQHSASSDEDMESFFSPTSSRTGERSRSKNSNNKRKQDDDGLVEDELYEFDMKGHSKKHKKEKHTEHPQEYWHVEESMISFAHLDEEDEEEMHVVFKYSRRFLVWFFTSPVGKFFAVGDRVWSAEKRDRFGEVEIPPSANGRIGMNLWKVGGLVIKYHGPLVLERVLERKKNRKEYKEIQKIRNTCTFSEPSEIAGLPTRRYNFLNYRFRLTPYYSLISLFWTLCSCFAQGQALTNPEICDGTIYFITVINTLAFLTDAYLRPFTVPFRNIATISGSFFLMVAGMAASTNAAPGSELFILAADLVVAALILGSVVAVFQVILKLSLVFCSGSVLLRRELWKKIQALLDEDLSAVELIRRAQQQARKDGRSADSMIPADEIVGVTGETVAASLL